MKLFAKFWLYGLLILAGFGVGTLGYRILLAPVNLANKALDSASGVVSRTLEPYNVINNYEWFFDVPERQAVGRPPYGR